jgi:ABC-type branched-subunit amino acid transport system substrate-binding protein
VAAFVKAIKARISTEPGFFEAQGYDTMSVIAEAAKTGTTREQIRTGLLGIKEMKLVTGMISIQPNGDATKSAVVLEVAKDGDTYIKTYVKTVDP